MLIYISGAITNDKHYRRKFAKAEKKLKKRGWKVINPAKIGDALPDLTWGEYIDIDVSLIKLADMVYMLPDYKKSKGACIEREVARELGKIVTYVI